MLPCHENTKAISNYPHPKTVKELKRFLGMANFFRKHIKNASEIMRPLYELTKVKKLNWTEPCTRAFQTIKEALTSPPLLAYPDFKETASEFIVTSDASNVAAGAMLSQVQHGCERVIAYASRVFSPAERNYATTERELTAIRYAVKHFKPLLYGRKYIIRTDHKPLIYLATMKGTDSKLIRTLEDLNMGHYSIEYVPGKTNVVADALSRSMNFTQHTVDIDESFKVNIKAEYVTIPGGPSSIFQCLSYALYGNLDEHSFIRTIVMDRVLKDCKELGFNEGRDTKRILTSMKNEDVLPCWQALLAFAQIFSKTVLVYQDGVGIVSFTSGPSDGKIHLHSLGGVHFNLMLVDDSQTNEPENKSRDINAGPEKGLYSLQGGEGAPNYNETTQDQCKIEQVAGESEQLAVDFNTIQKEAVLLTISEIRNMQKADKRLFTLIRWLKARRDSDWIRRNCNNLGPYSKLVSALSDLSVINSVLHHKKVPVIPNGNFNDLVVKFHVAAGHMGRDKLLAAVQDYYYNIDCAKVVATVTRECNVCQRFKGCSRGGEPLCMRNASKPYEQYAIDLLELEPAEANARYLLVGVDVCSRFLNAVPIKDKKAETVCAALCQRILPTLMRVPDIIISDNGPEFRASAFEQLLRDHNIKHYRTIPYLPHTNGRVERLNRTLQLMLSTACAESGGSWLKELPGVLTLYNHSKHAQTGKTPSEFFCDKRKLPIPTREFWRKPTKKFNPYKVGDLVGYKIPAYAKSGKLSDKYKGPCKVVETDNAGLTYDICCWNETRNRKAHYKQLKRWYGSWQEPRKEEQSKEIVPPVVTDSVDVPSAEEQIKCKINFAELFRELILCLSYLKIELTVPLPLGPLVWTHLGQSVKLINWKLVMVAAAHTHL